MQARRCSRRHPLDEGGAGEDLELEHLFVVYPGDVAYPLDERISTLPVAAIPGLPESLVMGESPGHAA